MNTNHTSGLDCAYCIDGFMPALDPTLGPHYTACPHCTAPCPCCGGTARFPLTDCLTSFIEALTTAALTAWLCPDCLGVLEVHR